MKRITSFAAAVLVIGGFISTAHAQLYWDINGATAGGSNSTTATGTWGAGGPLGGDFNNDGVVDAADYVIWRKTNSGDSAAYATWKANFGASGGGGGGANWTSDPSGTSTTTLWTDGQTATFSAGSGVTGAYTVTVSGTQSAAGVTFEEGNVTISGGTSLDLSGSATIDVDPLASGAAGTISSVIGGTVGLTKTSNGTLTLGGTNTYTGVTNVNAGMLAVTNTVGLGGSADGTVVSSGASLQIATTGTATIANEAININGTGSTGTNGALFKNSTGTTTLSGLVTLDSDARINGGGGGTLTLSGGVTGGGSLTVGGANNVTISSIASHAGGITKDGTATLTLSGANTYGGFTEVQSGVVAVSNATGLGTTSANTQVNDGAALQVSGAITIAEPIAISGTGISNAGALRKTANNNTVLSAGVTLNAPSRINSDSGTLTISSTGVLGGGQPLTVGGAGATTISGPLTIGSALLTKDGAGTLTLSANNASAFSGKIVVNGGVLAWSSDNGFTNHLGASPTVTDPAVAGYIFDYITVDGGTLRDTTSDTGGTSFMRTGRGIALGANGGTIDMSSATVGAKALYAGAITLATGVTSATLTKTGPGEFRYNGPGTNFSGFTKLVLKGGLFRSGSVTGQNWETAWGAVPASVTPDAITLDGGQFSSSFSLILNANRGITVATGGGTFVAGGGTITVPGPLSGSGKLTIGLAGAAFSSNSLTLTNANNTSTFTGSVEANSAVLTLNQSLNATNLTGNATGVSTADISVAANRVFTVGSDNTSTSYPGRIIGAGSFTKVGTGILTLNTAGTNTWTNTGGVTIDGGAIRFSAPSGFNDTVPVTVNNGGTLDMSDVSDTFGSLAGSAGGSVLQGLGNITLGQTAATNRTYSGSITSTGGTFTKAGGPWTQTLAGNNTLGEVNVNQGRLNFNGTNTTGAVNVGGGTLGGTGSVSGTVSLNSGTIAPGVTVESLDVGGLTLNGGSLEFELGALGSPGVTSDLINVTAANGLTINAGSVTLLDAVGLADGTYTLIDYVGSVQGLGVTALGTPTGPAGHTYSLQDSGTSIDLIVAPGGSGSGLGSGTVPEPASLVLCGLASLGLLRRRDR